MLGRTNRTNRRNKRNSRWYQKLSIPHFKLARLAPPGLSWWYLVVALIGLQGILVYGSVWDISDIQCQYNLEDCPTSLGAELNFLLGQNILKQSTHQKLLAWMNTKPELVLLEKKVVLPNHLLISIADRQIIARITDQAGTNQFYVSARGTLLVNVAETAASIPNIVFRQLPSFDQKGNLTDEGGLFALSLLEELKERKIFPSYIEVESATSIKVYLQPALTVITSSKQSVSRQVTTLQVILAKVTITPDFPVLDIRYKQPVLRPAT